RQGHGDQDAARRRVGDQRRPLEGRQRRQRREAGELDAPGADPAGGHAATSKEVADTQITAAPRGWGESNGAAPRSETAILTCAPGQALIAGSMPIVRRSPG